MLVFLELLCLVSVALAQVNVDGRNRVLFPEDDVRPGGNQGVSTTSTLEIGVRCTAPDNRQGLCIDYDKCSIFMNPRPDFATLQQYLCGFRGDVPKVCCPMMTRMNQEEDTPRTVTNAPTRRPAVTNTPTRRPPVTRPPIRNVTSVTPTSVTNTPTSRPSVTNSTSRPPVTNFTTRSETGAPMPFTSNRPSFLPEECGRNNVTLSRIVNGEEADVGAWPWLAALYIEERGAKSAECGAALISSNYVITAAHCITGDSGNVLSPRLLSVRLGDHDLFSSDDGTQPMDVAVISVTRHQQFQRRTFLNDIALLKLESSVEFSNHIQPICLPYDPPALTLDLEGKKGFVAGWGTTSFDGPSSPVVRQVQLPIWNQRECRNAYRREINITNAYLCAGLEGGGKDACQGDSGGPFMLPINPANRFHLVGIVSFGKQCAEPGFPGVYTNVRQYLTWITENIV